jgi:hypothetical protein
MKRYERPVIIASYKASDLKAEAAVVVANSYGGGNWNGWDNGPR